MASAGEESCSESTRFKPSEPTIVTGRSQYHTTISTRDGSSFNGQQENVSTTSLPYYSARIEHMIQRRSEFENEVEFQIEASRIHWSEVLTETGPASVEESASDQIRSNRQVFERLKEQWGAFFWDYGDRLVVGRKIAEGGQAEIYEADVQFPNAAESEEDEFNMSGCRFQFVAKVMKGPCSLLNLQSQLPLGMLQKIQEGCPFFLDTDSCCLIWGATLLDDDRFAFLMRRYWGDLRKLIDLRMRRYNNQRPPFRDESAILIMLQIAVAMEELHNHNILHRDLKASNVLVNLMDGNDDDACFDPWHDDELIQCAVTDFECSVGVVGTGYWRAPEVLAALKGGNSYPMVYSKQADVYSYAMTCYEILTGRIPFEGRPRTDYKFVLAGQRPLLPDCIRTDLKALICRCWMADPAQRPTFAEIVTILDKMYTPTLENELDEMSNIQPEYVTKDVNDN
ncbi:hypothetical protein M758_12G033600 [Ceratodon purpureus]|nr:hypothetical protein M758_12G033600 [Ceratodon purpureus]KAG0597963.1 hypothetical protein M758_12G033600 [Ceratodon purpureus]